MAPHIRDALGVARAWDLFADRPELYRRVRVGYVEEQRRSPTEFAKRLTNLVARSPARAMFGSWSDGGRLS